MPVMTCMHVLINILFNIACSFYSNYMFRSYLIILYATIAFAGGCQTVRAQGNTPVVISGYVSDAATGERLAGVTVVEANLKRGTVTGENGFYSIQIPSGSWSLQISYIGYRPLIKTGRSLSNAALNVEMEQDDIQLDEVVVEAQRRDENVRAPAMGVVKLDIKEIRIVPPFLGEVDVVKALQLMPGVQATSEGSTGFSVRGGNSDQNLILLDDAPVYNSGHLLGFFSIFNNDAVKDVTLYKGDIPAAYGGRLSSLLDIEMKEGDMLKHSVAGSVGTISSKLTVDGPVVKERASFLVAGRRTYADVFLPLAKEEDVRDSRLYFSDMNMKLSVDINNSNRVYFTGYSGKDIFGADDASVSFGNTVGSLKWNHRFSQNLYMDAGLSYSRYSYNIGYSDSDSAGVESQSLAWTSDVTDVQQRIDFTHYINARHKLNYGVSAIYHSFSPGKISGSDGNIDLSFNLPSTHAIESGLYAGDEFKASESLTLRYGIRFTTFHNVGAATAYTFDGNYQHVDSVSYQAGDIYNTHSGVEPRFAFTLLLNSVSSVKGSYSHTVQFVTLAQNSASGTPLNVWFPASPNIDPQLCDNISAGYFRNFSSNMYEVSGEAYYKSLRNLIDFRDHAELFLNKYLEGEVRKGKGHSYGFEFLMRKNRGVFTGWLGYTYSRSFRIVPAINNGKKYPALYDKPHTINMVASYAPKRRLSFSAAWTYATGLPLTLPAGKAVIGNSILPVYSDRNSYRMEDYHRLDVSLTLKEKEKPGRKWHSELNLSVYNVYNRHNAWAVNIVQDEDNHYSSYAEKTYLFAVLPALTFNFNF